MRQEGRTLYVGVDESNHGRFPEIFAAVYSNLVGDISKGKFRKAKKDYPRIRRQVIEDERRDYSFLLLNEGDSIRIPEINLMGIIIGNLIEGRISQDTNSLKILLDGEWGLQKRLRIKEIVSEFCDFPKSNIRLDCGKDFDKMYPLVNMADGIARHVLRSYTPILISNDENHRPLIY